MKCLLKSELADMAGVSERTLQRWMKRKALQLRELGVDTHTKIIPPHAVRYICKEYGIDL